MRFFRIALFIGLVATLSQGLANFVLKNALKQFNKQYPGLASMSRSTRSSLTHAGYDGLSPKIKNMVQKYKMRANRPLPVWKTVNTINITWIKWHNGRTQTWFRDYWKFSKFWKIFWSFCWASKMTPTDEFWMRRRILEPERRRIPPLNLFCVCVKLY